MSLTSDLSVCSIHDSPEKGTGDVTFHSIWTDEGPKDENDRHVHYRASPICHRPASACCDVTPLYGDSRTNVFLYLQAIQSFDEPLVLFHE